LVQKFSPTPRTLEEERVRVSVKNAYGEMIEDLEAIYDPEKMALVIKPKLGSVHDQFTRKGDTANIDDDVSPGQEHRSTQGSTCSPGEREYSHDPDDHEIRFRKIENARSKGKAEERDAITNTGCTPLE